MRTACGWIYAIDRYGYPPSIDDILKAVREMAGMGFKYIEMEGVSIEGLNERSLTDIAKRKDEIRRLCDDLGVRVLAFLPIIADLVSLDKPRREKALSLFDLSVEIAEAFSSEFLYTDTFTAPLRFVGEAPYEQSINFGKEFRIEVDPDFSWQAVWDVLVDSIAACTERAGRAGMKLLVEPRLGENVSNTEGLTRLIEAVGDDNLGVLFDPAHLYPQKEILPLSVEKLGRHIYYVHIADSDGATNEHLPPGSGTVDWTGIFAALKKHDFAGDFGIDIGVVPDVEREFVEADAFVRKMWADA